MTNLRGPTTHPHLARRRINALVPLAAAPGNIGVTFTMLSYADTLTVSVITDPDIVPEPAALADPLHASFARLAEPGRADKKA